MKFHSRVTLVWKQRAKGFWYKTPPAFIRILISEFHSESQDLMLICLFIEQLFSFGLLFDYFFFLVQTHPNKSVCVIDITSDFIWLLLSILLHCITFSLHQKTLKPRNFKVFAIIWLRSNLPLDIFLTKSKLKVIFSLEC